MRNGKLNLALSLGVIFVLVLGCSFSLGEPKITGLRLSASGNHTDRTEVTTFARNATVYIIGDLSSVKANYKARCHLFFDNVRGETSGEMIPNSELVLNLQNNTGFAAFNYSMTTGAWRPGTYRAEVTLLDEAGAQKDQKSITFTVS